MAFKSQEPFYFGIGRTSPWSQENKPPNVTGEETEVEELFGFVKSKFNVEPDPEEPPDYQSCVFVVEDSDGEILYRDRKYRVVADEDAHNEFATSLLFQITLPLDAFPGETTYRQVGLFLGLDPSEGYEGDDVIAPENVDDVGELYSLSNFRRINRTPDKLERVKFIINFG